MRVGVLTGGGDCPGANAALRAIVRRGEAHYGDELIGFLDTWHGLLDDRTLPLDVRSLQGILPRSGTLLRTRRGSPFDEPDGPARVTATLERHDLDALVVIGGKGTLTVAAWLHDRLGIPIVGVPKTVDNDVIGADVTFGFHTAVQVGTDAIDRLDTTSETDDRVVLVEVMGRHAGWIATYAGIAGGAAVILVPELPFDVDEVCAVLRSRRQRGRRASIVVVAEGALPKAGTLDLPERRLDAFGHVKSGHVTSALAPEIERRTGFDTRVVHLGHIQRGGSPNAYDRVLATRYGLGAIDAVHEGSWGDMVVCRGDRIERASIRVAIGRTRSVDLALFRDVAEVFFG